MSEASMADDVYQPTGTNEEQEDAAPLDLQDAVDERTYDDMLDEGYSPPDEPMSVTKAGTTASEQHEGESLDERLEQEVPDVTAPDEGARTDATEGAATGAEEAAVNVVPDEQLPPAGEVGE
ncbi:hypothetical protein [Streptomyces cupreus]|uniref:DUF5709 domain-containing protein n=1 Tax=Streptomyces cupreus TaxID=2759956 RepID=A0A7X1MEZ6_9ACTN|nr:hypothetical protein [Streptomyces cupreus]MBC2906235.1 hypothetical protein [Streptomyces cupreus]